jgi:hypothetical protein
LWIKKRNVVGDAGRIKEEVEGTAARRRRRRARFDGFDTHEGIPGLVGSK